MSPFFDSPPEAHPATRNALNTPREASCGEGFVPSEICREERTASETDAGKADADRSGNTATETEYLHDQTNDSSLTTFLWKGQNYLLKMATDLEFLDDPSVAAPVSAWLGFSARCNPFLMPPEGHDVCESLRRGHDERCERAADRRRQRRRRDSNSERRHSRSRGNTASGARAAVLDPPEPHASRRQSENRTVAPGFGGGNGGGSDVPASSVSAVDVQGTRESSDRPQTPSAQGDPVTVTNDSGRGNNAHGRTMTETSIGSASVSTDPLRRGLDKLEERLVPCELSSGEEEEVRWRGGGCLDIPIVPTPPESILRKASAANEVLRFEVSLQEVLERKASGTLSSARRAREMLREPREEHWSRVDSLALKSFREDLRSALKERHVGATTLRPLWVTEMASSSEGSLGREIAEPITERGRGRTGSFTARGNGNKYGDMSAPVSRAGVRVFAEAWEDRMEGTTNGTHARSATGDDQDRGTARGSISSIFASTELLESRPRNGASPSSVPSVTWPSFPATDQNQPASGERLNLLSVHPGVTTEPGGSVTSLLSGTDLSASASLHASSSSMSSRARAKVVAGRPTAMRRPRWHGGGKTIVTDPTRSMETRERAAVLIQAAFMGVRSRSYVRRLRETQAEAAATVNRLFRGWVVRNSMRRAKRTRRAEELRQRARDRQHNRAANLIVIFFRDIGYQKQRVSELFERG